MGRVVAQEKIAATSREWLAGVSCKSVVDRRPRFPRRLRCSRNSLLPVGAEVHQCVDLP